MNHWTKHSTYGSFQTTSEKELLQIPFKLPSIYSMRIWSNPLIAFWSFALKSNKNQVWFLPSYCGCLNRPWRTIFEVFFRTSSSKILICRGDPLMIISRFLNWDKKIPNLSLMEYTTVKLFLPWVLSVKEIRSHQCFRENKIMKGDVWVCFFHDNKCLRQFKYNHYLFLIWKLRNDLEIIGEKNLLKF